MIKQDMLQKAGKDCRKKKGKKRQRGRASAALFSLLTGGLIADVTDVCCGGVSSSFSLCFSRFWFRSSDRFLSSNGGISSNGFVSSNGFLGSNGVISWASCWCWVCCSGWCIGGSGTALSRAFCNVHQGGGLEGSHTGNQKHKWDLHLSFRWLSLALSSFSHSH